jgi:hypothetical protein
VELNYALEKRGFQVSDAVEFMKSIGYSLINIIDNENYVFKKI